MDMCELSMLLRLERSCRFDETEIVHQVVFRPSFRSMICRNKSYLIVWILGFVWVCTAHADLFLCKTFVFSHDLLLTIMQVVGMGRSQLGKTTASVSSYWALLHHYKRPFFLLFFDIRQDLNSEA